MKNAKRLMLTALAKAAILCAGADTIFLLCHFLKLL